MALASHQHEEFKEMELWEHLAELRTRLIRSLCYVVLGLVVAWILYPRLESLLFAPLRNIEGVILVYRTFTQGFMLRLQLSLLSGLIVAIPLMTLEAWGFIAPGLTRRERRACYLVFPISLIFFFAGIVAGYGMLSFTIGYFANYISGEFELMQDPLLYLTFMVKMVLALGLCFQFPVVLMFLGWIGFISSKTLRGHWRAAVLICFITAAFVTPADPVTMVMIAGPLVMLFIGSIFLVSLVERFRIRDREA
jgi:sec-independent protein translocase protein TatC